MAASDEFSASKASLDALREALKKTREELLAAKEAAAQNAEATDEAKQKVKELTDAQKGLVDQLSKAEKAQKAQSTASDLMQRAFGGGEFAEKMKKVGDGFAVWGDKSQTLGTRLQALGGATALAGQAFMGVASHVANAVNQIGEYITAAEQAALAQSRLNDQARAMGPAFNSISQATRGTVDAAEAAVIRQAMLSQHLEATEATMTSAAVAARAYANTFGGTVTEAAQRFAQAVAQDDAAALAEFNVQLTHGIPVQDRWRQALQQSAEAARQSGAEALTETERREQQVRGAEIARERYSQLYTTIFPGLLGLRTLHERYAQGLAESEQAERRQASAAQSAAAARTRAAAEQTRLEQEAARRAAELTRANAELSQRIKQASDDQVIWNARMREGVTAAQDLRERTDALGGVIADNTRLRTTRRQAYRAWMAQGHHTGEEVREAAGMAGVDLSEGDASRELTRAVREAQALEIPTIQLTQRITETRSAFLSRLTQAYRAAIEPVRAYDHALEESRIAALRANQQREATRQLEEQEMERAERLRSLAPSAHDSGTELAERRLQLAQMLAAADERLAEATRQRGEAEGDQAQRLAQAAVDAAQAESNALQGLRQRVAELQRSRRDAHDEYARQLADEQRQAETQQRIRAQSHAREVDLQRGIGPQDYSSRVEQARRELASLNEERARVEERANSDTGTEADRHELESLQARAQAAREYQDNLLSLQQAQSDASDGALQMSRAVNESLQLQQTSAQQWASFTGGAISTVTGAFKQHFAALITGKETAAQALEGMLQDTLTSLASEAAVRAIFMTATGVADLATYQYAQAAQAFTSAGIFAAVAGVAGAGAYGLSRVTAGAQQAGASGGSQFASAAPTPAASQAPQSQPVMINFYSSNPIDDRHTIRAGLEGLLRDMAREGRAPWRA